jgi:hypothetical protein
MCWFGYIAGVMPADYHGAVVGPTAPDAEVQLRMLLEMFVEMPEEIARDSRDRSIAVRLSPRK